MVEADGSSETEFTIHDIEANRVTEPVVDEGDEVTVMTRGAERVLESLLSQAKERTLTDEEILQLQMIYGVIEPTKAFAEYVMSQGAEA